MVAVNKTLSRALVRLLRFRPPAVRPRHKRLAAAAAGTAAADKAAAGKAAAGKTAAGKTAAGK